ncbi:hypothetical protein E2C01_016748 [Portunus trituberculatus]|uniref:Uncharacterized protein n=1 Tax=Portunus trituberculatus TaxID=210409 RepID=A0A5B7DRD1_PORTR|nr:hypothetical protein [Portunus trituberculatus]
MSLGSHMVRCAAAKFGFKSPSVHSVVRGHPTIKSEFRQAEIHQVLGLTVLESLELTHCCSLSLIAAGCAGVLRIDGTKRDASMRSTLSTMHPSPQSTVSTVTAGCNNNNNNNPEIKPQIAKSEFNRTASKVFKTSLS